MTSHRILFIAPTRIGDAVLATSILRHLLANAPTAKITIVTSPLAAPLYEGYPLLERIIPITKRTYNRHWLEVWREAIGTKWAAVWDMRGSVLSFLLRIGKRHVYTKQKPGMPKVKQYEKAFGIAPLPPPILWPSAADIAQAEALMPAPAKYLIFAPMANWLPKEWPLEHFIALAKILLEGDYAGYRPIIICAANERPRALPMVEALSHYRPLDLTEGTTPLLTLYAIMQRVNGFVGNDSGLMHMACAAGTPTIGLFGPTPNIGDNAPHVRFLYAPNSDLAQLMPNTVAQMFTKQLSTANSDAHVA
ncbi:MAG: glycosyltransferase family 9 protein [Rickettsiales bacterium]